MSISGPVLKLVKGSAELDLNDGRYLPSSDFVPPPLNLSVQIVSGTSANRFDGGTRISSKAQDRKWEFGIDVLGESVAEIAQGVADVQWFLDQAGDPSEPVCLHYRDNSNVGFEPLWGQFGANYRYEILSGNLQIPSGYAMANIRGQRLIRATMSTKIKPYAHGLRQRLASALGGVLHDTIRAADGFSRGLIIPEATTNKMTNPVFSHATYDNGWTATSLVVSENTDKKFVSHGESSAKLTDPAGGGQFTQSINVGNTNTHVLSCYAKLPAGGAISATQAEIYYNGSTQTTTYTLIRDGVYRLTASFAGVNAAVTAGIEVKASYTVYADGFQLEEKSYATPTAHGELLGCTWTGTAHASTSTRTAARLRADEANSIDSAEGTIRLVWKPDKGDDDFTADAVLWWAESGNMRAAFLSGSDAFEFTDGTNTATSAAQIFATNDVLILHYVFDPINGLVIYLNGVSIATDSIYTPPSGGTDLYIGTSDTATLHSNGTYMDFTTFAQAMSATEVTDDYDNILEQVEDDRRLSPIPYLWTKDGDDVVDNVNESGTDNFCVIAGIPGSAPVEIEISGWLSTGWDVIGAVWISRVEMELDEFANPDTPGSNINVYWNGDTSATPVGTSFVSLGIMPASTRTPMHDKTFYGKDFHLFTRLSDAGSGLIIKSQLADGAFVLDSEELTVAADGTNRLFRTLVNTFMERRSFTSVTIAPAGGLFGKRGSGSADVTPDWRAIMMEPLVKIGPPSAIKANVVGFVYKGREALPHGSVAQGPGAVAGNLPVVGQPLEVLPEMYNVLMSILGDIGADPVTTWTMTYSDAWIEPRWALL